MQEIIYMNQDFVIVAAMSSNGVIGNGGNLIWHIKNDMEMFKEITMGHTVVMGYNTYLTLPGKKPLSGRRNIILSSRLVEPPHGFEIASSIDDVIDMTKDDGIVFIIGGGKVYEQFLPIVDYMFITYIDCEFNGDTRFPEYNIDDWEVVKSIEIPDDPTVDFVYYFLDIRRKKEEDGE